MRAKWSTAAAVQTLSSVVIVRVHYACAAVLCCAVRQERARLCYRPAYAKCTVTTLSIAVNLELASADQRSASKASNDSIRSDDVHNITRTAVEPRDQA